MSSPGISVTVYSDLACPWCYVGQKRLESAIRHLQVNNAIESLPIIDVTWKPYQIDPSTANSGERVESYCRRRWGGSGWTDHLKSEGAKDGALFHNWKWWPNTLKAHQMVQFLSERYGVDTAKTNAALFKAIYEEGKNISLPEVLVQIAKEEQLGAVVEENALREYLENDAGAQHVKAEIQSGQDKFRVKSVPFFVIGRGDNNENHTPYGLSGAQSSGAFLRVFETLASEL